MTALFVHTVRLFIKTSYRFYETFKVVLVPIPIINLMNVFFQENASIPEQCLSCAVGVTNNIEPREDSSRCTGNTYMLSGDAVISLFLF